MKQYVIYKRVSTADQGRSGLGLEAQQRDVDLFLANYSDCLLYTSDAADE